MWLPREENRKTLGRRADMLTAIVVLLCICLVLGIAILALIIVGVMGTAKGVAAFHSALATTILRMDPVEQEKFLGSLDFWMMMTLANVPTDRALRRAQLFQKEIVEQIELRREARRVMEESE